MRNVESERTETIKVIKEKVKMIEKCEEEKKKANDWKERVRLIEKKKQNRNVNKCNQLNAI